MAKAASLAADEIVLDLEDAVAPANKTGARDRVVALLSAPEWHRRTVAVRINARQTPWHADDVAALARVTHPNLTVVVPKVEAPKDIDAIVSALGADVDIQALIETARGLANVQEIAGASPRLRALILGYADLASSLGRRAGSEAGWRSAQDAVLLAARANGIQAIDGPFLQIKADDKLRADAELVRDLGFDGKWVIHPSHIDVVNAIFTPTDEEVARARAVVATLDRGDAVAVIDGQMIDEAMRAGALRTLAQAGLAA